MRSWTVVPFVVASLSMSGCGDDGDPATTGGGGAGGSGGALPVGGGGTSATGGQGGSGKPLPDVFTVTGIVVDGDGEPLEGAFVMQGGGEPEITTGPDGTFSIELTQEIPGRPAVVAGKIGYRTAGEDFYFLPEDPVELVVYAAEPPDNTAYIYGHPGWGEFELDINTEYCGHCHTLMTFQFQSSGHRHATKNERLQDLYAGVSRAHTDQASCTAAGGVWRAGRDPGTESDSVDKCYLGMGVLPDLNGCGGPAELACDDPALPAGSAPTEFGQCADCHAIGIDGVAGGRNLHDAVGIAYEYGNHCDPCHHVAEVDLTKPAGLGGALRIQRPHEKQSDAVGAPVRQVIYGPYPDVPNPFMGGSYQPQYEKSEFCGGCHEQRQQALIPGQQLDPARWPDGLPTLSTYSEWEAGPWNNEGTQCRYCHMLPIEGLFNTVDITQEDTADGTFGFYRTPEQMRSHEFTGPLQGNPRLVDTAMSVALMTNATPTTVEVDVAVSNVGAGHAVPTGEALRSLVLLVRVEGCGETFDASAGLTVPDFGGGGVEGVVGVQVAAAGPVFTWAEAANRAQVGDLLRVVRPTGTFDDYPGVGFFADPLLTPAEKGMEIHEPVGEAVVQGIAGSDLTLDAAIAVLPGDVVFLGDDPGWPITDGALSAALSGAAGYAFARVLVDEAGARSVPHYRAVDMASDNRIAPGGVANTHHEFDVPVGCTAADVSAVLLYRQVPVGLSRERGWDAADYLIASASEAIVIP